jgi:hypothetical protein
MKREDKREKTLAAEVREWILSTSGNFLSTDVTKDLQLSTRSSKQNVSMILKRLCDDGIIEKYGTKRGSFRPVDRTFQEQCWWEDSGLPLPVKFPLGVDKFVKVFAGNVILLEGQKSQGKSAFSLEFCRLNKNLFGTQKTLYQNVEMANSELFERFEAYGDVMPPDEWKRVLTVIRQTGEWWDKIQPDGLNVVDYLIEYEKSYLIADYVWRIHQKLKTGIALVVIQRDPFKPYGAGGRGTRDIPRLVMSLIKHKIRLEDVKSFYPSEHGNPTGLARKYKQASWWNFIPDSEWEHEEDAKYEAFKKFKL